MLWSATSGKPIKHGLTSLMDQNVETTKGWAETVPNLEGYFGTCR